MHVRRINWSNSRDVGLSLLVLLALAMPFVRLPADHKARIVVHFNAPGMRAPHVFSALTTASICAVMASTLAYEDPESGNYTRVRCEN